MSAVPIRGRHRRRERASGVFVSAHPDGGGVSRSGFLHGVFGWACFGFGILVVFLVGSLLLSGAQVTAGGDPAWDAAIPFPPMPEKCRLL